MVRYCIGGIALALKVQPCVSVVCVMLLCDLGLSQWVGLCVSLSLGDFMCDVCCECIAGYRMYGL